MDQGNEAIEALKAALAVSPDNIPLRQHLAQSLLKAHRFEEAEHEFTTLVRTDPSAKNKLGLARCYLRTERIPAALVVLEELLDQDANAFDAWLLYARALVEEGSLGKAREAYEELLRLEPGFRDEDLERALKVPAQMRENHAGEDTARGAMEKPEFGFEAVGGLDAVKEEIRLKIILPMEQPDLYAAYGKKAGGGLLLYGPPGCGKTHLARATAGQIQANFYAIGLQDVLDMWIGNSEKNLHALFEQARSNTPCVLFFDEIDALGASRSDMRHSAGRMLINQFLQEMDGIGTNNEGILIIGATNAPWSLDTAFRRPGRFDRILFVPPPDRQAREAIFRIKLDGKPVEQVDHAALAAKTDGYSGADIEAIVDLAIEAKLQEAMKAGSLQPLKKKDLLQAAKRHKASTAEWFQTAKNYALFSNASGLYDDVLRYLKLSR